MIKLTRMAYLAALALTMSGCVEQIKRVALDGVEYSAELVRLDHAAQQVSTRTYPYMTDVDRAKLINARAQARVLRQDIMDAVEIDSPRDAFIAPVELGALYERGKALYERVDQVISRYGDVMPLDDRRRFDNLRDHAVKAHDAYQRLLEAGKDERTRFVVQLLEIAGAVAK